jgi:Skp family chaperone for outer membrane proteins
VHTKLTKIEKKLDAFMHKFNKGNNTTDINDSQNSKKSKLK